MKICGRVICCLLLVCLLAGMLPLDASAARTNDCNTIDALNSLLSGITNWYFRGEADISYWSDDQLLYTMHGKLLNEVMGMDTYLQDHMGQQFRHEDDGIHFDLDFVQTLCRSAFDAELPLATRNELLWVEGDDVIIVLTAGEHTQLYVSNYARQGDVVLATGCAVYSNPMGQQLMGYFLAEFEVNSDSIYGYTLRTIRDVQSNQTMAGWRAKASSELKQNYGTHYASYLLDGDPATAWCEGAGGVGLGEWVELTTADGMPREVSGIEIRNGYLKNQDIQTKNGWVTKIRVECDEGYSQEFDLDWNDLDYSNILLFDQAIFTSRVRITILEAEAGRKYQDTCISEICLLGLDSSTFFPEIQPTEPTEPPMTTQSPEEITIPATVPVSTEAAPTQPAESEPPAKEDNAQEAPGAEAQTGPSVWMIGAVVTAVLWALVLMLQAFRRKKR